MSINKTLDDISGTDTDDRIVSSNAIATPIYAFSLASTNTYRSYQWYLDGSLTEGGNAWGANVDSVSSEYTGMNVRIGIIDQGFDIGNIDLAGRFDLTGSYDPRDVTGSTSIRPDSVSDVHGTWVSGVIGASATNALGTVGVASDATLVGYYARFGFGGSSVNELAQLLAMQVNVDVTNCSWGFTTSFSDNFRSSSWSGVQTAITNAIVHGRDSLGTVYVFAAGNDRQYVANSTSDGDNTNNHSLTNSRFVITTAASTETGHIASFSTPGASVFVTAPGDSILTTTLDNGDGNRNNDFTFVSGTSFAAPIVSGTVALMLEANANLGYRDVQEILALSSHKLDATSSSWATNGATNWNGGGNIVSHDYGFGLVDAHAAVRLAETWTQHDTAANEQVIAVAGRGTTLLSQSSPTLLSLSVAGDHQNFAVQWVELDVTLRNAKNGDIRIELVSPDGTDSVLLDHPGAGTNASGNLNFTFSTNHNWGETPDGTWTVVIHDTGTNGTDAITSYALRIYGSDQGANDTFYYTDDFANLSGNRNSVSDASGNDTINAAAVTSDLTLDLMSGHTSIIAGRAVFVGAATVIENAFGGDGNDLIIGNEADNNLTGGRGHNVLQGGAGNDVLDGGPDGSRLEGGVGNDVYLVRSTGDLVVENATDGVDGARVYIDGYALPTNVENGLAELTSGQTLFGNGGDNWLRGNIGNDMLSGGAGNDQIDGGGGIDLMIGGTGDDVYVVDSPFDAVVEQAGEGLDVVYVAVSGFAMAANIEVGALTIATGGVLTGNDGDNVLWGNTGNDTLNGGAGNDTLLGGLGADTMAGDAGDDIYAIDNLGDVIVERPGEGLDIAYTTISGYVLSDHVDVGAIAIATGAALTAGATDTVLWGNDGNDTLIGRGGNDVLIGGRGADAMIGGAGNDIYVVDNVGDGVVELGNGGTDTVYVMTTGYTLADNVEVGAVNVTAGLTLTGNDGDNFLWGNSGDDRLIGGAGNDFISGGAGADTLRGGTGNDTFVVDNAGDVVIEHQNEGADTVLSLLSDFTIPSNIEIGGIITDNGAILRANNDGNSLWGGQGNDSLIGGNGNDTLGGGGGQDILTGGSGNDTFVFARGTAQGDLVTDFRGFNAGEGDQLIFSGYGLSQDGARFTQIDTAHWEITSADGLAHEQIAFSNHAALSASDWHFV